MENELASIRGYDIVKLVEQKYKVNWGGFNNLKSILYLTQETLKNHENIYFHLISRHDDALFARKFEYPMSSDLLEKLSL
jgi:hypothetical protein